MDNDYFLKNFFNYAEGKKIYEIVMEQLPVQFPKGCKLSFSKKEVVDALIFHLHKYHIDILTVHFVSKTNERFISIWDKISETL